MSFARSQTIGNYEFLGIVDKPKAGVTYKVRNLVTRKLELLRALPGSSLGDPESAERFLREIKIHTRLSHPNIVAFHDALQLDGQLVMTTEYVEGDTLAKRMTAGALPPAEALAWIRDVLAALQEAHALGIVHRGITPESLIITREGTVKLGGFGLAKPVSDLSLTRAGSVLGDPGYIAPEQVSGRAAVDCRADIYSAGVLLYQALTGTAPFQGHNDYEIMVAQVSKEPASPRAVRPEISPELEKIVLTALAKDPLQRFSSAGAFREALGGCPELSSGASPPSFVAPPAAARRPKKPILLGALSLLIGLGILILLVFHKL